MANFSVHVSTVKRSSGQNAIASAAYNSRSKLSLNATDKDTNITVQLAWDYSKKDGLAYSQIHAPENAPEWVHDREKLWNKAEQAENRCNSVTAGKVMIALPNEFSIEQNIELVKEITAELVSLGIVVDTNIHNDNKNNPHAHLMHTTRELVENRYGEVDFSPLKNRDWQGPKWTRFVRELSADMINKHYELNGFEQRISHKSYAELGVDLEASVHEGPAKNIKNSELTVLNREIAAGNVERIKANPSIILYVLGIKNPVFTKEQIATELEKRLHAGIDFNNINDIESLQSELSITFVGLYEKILVSPEISQVVEEDLKGRTLYTTTKRLELEERFVSNVEELHSRNNHSLGIKDSDLDHLSWSEKVISKVHDIKTDVVGLINDKTGLKLEKPRQEISLSGEQRRAIVNILNGSDISVLEGIPGAGKTTAMREIVRQYKKAGMKVIGVAPSSAASLELAKATGIECKNASLWRKEWLNESGKKFDLMLKGDYYKEDLYKDSGSSLTNKHVMIIDEASMGELSNMDYLISEARAVGAKVLKVGDNNQLSPVGWSGALGKAISICGSERLEESRRQKNLNHQEATKLLSQYRVRDALDIYWKEGAIKVAENESEANSMAVRSFVSSYIETAKSIEKDDLISTRSKAIGVFENKTRNLLNTQVREQLKEAGILKGKEHRVLVGSSIKDGKREKQYLSLSRGEQVVFARNANRLGRDGIFNGELGTVLKVHTPNSDLLAKIDILVHRANGKKETVSLDLDDLAKNKYTGKYFHDGISIDHGYAVTSHKVQGASIDDFIVRLEKNIGFEVFNVLSTRHKNSIEIIADKDVLHDSFYEALDESSEGARNRFAINTKDEESLLKGGLAKMISKRSNTSFASDYRTMGQTKEDKYIKQYIDKSEETISTLRKITSWQSIEHRKTGIKPQMWEHESWSKFIEKRKERNLAATAIKSGDYSKFKDRLIQLNMNYATIEKHSSQLGRKSSELDKVTIDQKISELHNQDVFKNLVQSISSGQTIAVRAGHREVNMHIADSRVSIEEKSGDIKDLTNHSQEIRDAIVNEKHYREILTPEYLNRIYHTFEGVKEDAGSEVLRNYQSMVTKHGKEKATSMLVKDPTILGALRGYGVGRLFGISNERKDAIALCGNLKKQLDGFNKSGEMEQQYTQQLKDGDFANKINILENEIEHLRSLLPSDIDNELMQKVGESLDKTKGQNIDWRELQKSELFESVRVNQYTKSELATSKDTNKDIDLKVSTNKSVVEAEGAVEKKEKPNLDIKKQQQNTKPSLTFADVKSGLRPSMVSEIFKSYAPLINPDGKISNKSGQINSGSLHMSLGGQKMGLWNRFSDGSKGDIFSFVEEARGCSKYESLEIVASHAGIVATVKDFDNRSNLVERVSDVEAKKEVENKDIWKAISIVPESAPNFDSAKDLSFLIKKGNTVSLTHEYRNQDNKLLGYSVRVEENESGKKQVLPVAYCDNEAKATSRWQLKGFSDAGSKPIYGLEKVSQNALKPILIVEGEKTSDAASKLFPNHNVISWMGGAQSVDRVDWSKLTNKLVSIWPDNDKPGIDAARNIANHIDCHNEHSGLVSVVNTESLNLPNKWDLADDIPKNSILSDSNLDIIVDDSSKKALNIGNILKESQASASDQIIPNAIDMLEAQGRIDRDAYSSKDMYHATMSALAKSNDIDLTRENAGETFVDNVRELQTLYRGAVQGYKEDKLHNSGLESNDTPQDKLKNEFICQTHVLHTVHLGQNKLTKTHTDHIEKTVVSEIGKMQRFSDSEKGHVANNIFKIVSSKEWADKLDSKNDEKTNIVKTIDRFKSEIQSANTPHEIIDIRAKEQGFLIGLGDNHNEGLKQSVLDAKENKANNVLDGLKQELQANVKQGIKSDQELTSILKKAENTPTAVENLKEMTASGQQTYLRRVRIQIGYLEKLSYNLDKDQLVKELKPMTYEERENHIDNILVKEIKKYVEPLISNHEQDREKAKNYPELLSVMKKEQETYLHLHKNYEMAIYALDKSNGNMKLSIGGVLANDINNLGGMSHIQKSIDHAINQGLITGDQIVNNLKKNDTNIKILSADLHEQCVDHHKEQIDHNLNHLSHNNTLSIDNHNFTDPGKYLNYIKDNHSHSFMPTAHIDAHLNEHAKQQLQHEKHEQHQQEEQKELELHKGMGGLSL